ncbi:MAG: SDR family oxidoreductase [Pseudomonadota bacterium]
MTDFDLSGRHALITGGARGLGLVMAQALAGAGARVTITAARSADELEAAVADIGPERCLGVLSDVMNDEDNARLASAAQERFGPVDILINNAGRGLAELYADGDFSQATPFSGDPEAYERILCTNVLGPWKLAKLFVSDMVARGWGRIINVSTSRPTMLLSVGGPYGPTKAALEAQSAIWAKHLQGTGVTVNVLLPGGAADTPFIPGGEVGTRITDAWPARAGEIAEGNSNITGLLPAEVMAAPALWLASDASSDFTGRRFVGANWPPDAAPEEALKTAMTPTIDAPHIL